VAGAVVGGLLGNQVGGGSGKKVATVGGAIAGGVAGHNIEKNRNDGDSYDLVVEMDNGRRVTISQRQLDGIREGDRVYVSGGRARLI
jgi:outer membrane lipoprotein SlyB